LPDGRHGARGFKRGDIEKNEKAVDFSVGEILVSTEDISDNRQLIWEGFAGNPTKDEYTTYLFFYDSVESKADKSLFRLFEDYFEKLPDYKKKTAVGASSNRFSAIFRAFIITAGKIKKNGR
jgi:hypothetical protein